jgi:hypothetical protein
MKARMSRSEVVRRIDVPAATISYRRAGSGPAVLMIQGVGVIGEGWRPQIDGLADRHTTLTFDTAASAPAPWPGGAPRSRTWPATRSRSWTPRRSIAHVVAAAEQAGRPEAFSRTPGGTDPRR